MRGLKLPVSLHFVPPPTVASFTDAWIETFDSAPELGKEFVASFTDAWIETNVAPAAMPSSVSHLLQMRGLKQNQP